MCNQFIQREELPKKTKISRAEKVLLHFVKPMYSIDETTGLTIKYKILRGKVYILDRWHQAPPWSFFKFRCVVVKKNEQNES